MPKRQSDTFRLGVNFAIKSMDNAPVMGTDETEEVITIEGYANFSGTCVDESTTMMDRVGDIVVPSGIEITNYKKSPVILFQHDRDNVIGKAVTITQKPDGLFVKAEIHAGACEHEIFYAIKNGLFTSFSIGFRTKKAEWKPVGDTEVFFITKSELLEVSVVSIPCNTDSTFSLVKSFEGNFYAGDVDFTPKSAPTADETTTCAGDNTMRIKLRDMLPEDKVKELEGLGLAETLDEFREVDTKSFIEALVHKQVAAAVKEAMDAFSAEQTKTDEPVSEEAVEPEQPAEETASEEDSEAKEDAENEVVDKEDDVEAIKSLTDAIATLKAVVAEEK